MLLDVNLDVSNDEHAERMYTTHEAEFPKTMLML